MIVKHALSLYTAYEKRRIGSPQLSIKAPDDALKRSMFHNAWSAEINALASKIDGIPAAKLDVYVARTVAEIVPKLRLYENEMKSTRDRLFADLIKRVAMSPPPALALAHVTGLSLGQAALGFATAFVVPAVADYFQRTAEVKRTRKAT